jgi:PAS domain S-box-containing protein
VEGKPTASTAIQERAAQADRADLALTGRRAWPDRRRDRAGRDRLAEHAPIGVQELDATGRFVEANSAFCRMIGYTRAELVGRSIADFIDLDAATDTLERLQDLGRRGSGHLRFDLAFMRRNGTLLQGRITAATIPGEASGTTSIIVLVEDAANPDTESAAIHEERIDAVVTVADAVAQARDAAYEKGIDIAFGYSGDPVWVRADQAQLRRAVDHLLATTVRSAQQGSVAVRCTTLDGQALLEVLQVRKPGSAGADLSLIFGERAEPGDADAEPVADGRALGPVQTLVRAQRGKVEVSSSTENGSRITLRLPLARG